MRDTYHEKARLITVASSGVGAIYADPLVLVRHSHDFILIAARNREPLGALATHLNDDTGRSVGVIVADLNNETNVARLEQGLHSDASTLYSSTMQASP